VFGDRFGLYSTCFARDRLVQRLRPGQPAGIRTRKVPMPCGCNHSPPQYRFQDVRTPNALPPAVAEGALAKHGRAPFCLTRSPEQNATDTSSEVWRMVRVDSTRRSAESMPGLRHHVSVDGHPLSRQSLPRTSSQESEHFRFPCRRGSPRGGLHESSRNDSSSLGYIPRSASLTQCGRLCRCRSCLTRPSAGPSSSRESW